jgi:hypothetical protein
LDGVSGWWFSTAPFLSTFPSSPSSTPTPVTATNQYGLFYTTGAGSATLMYSSSTVRGLTLSPFTINGAGLLFGSLWSGAGQPPNSPNT